MRRKTEVKQAVLMGDASPTPEFAVSDLHVLKALANQMRQMPNEDLVKLEGVLKKTHQSYVLKIDKAHRDYDAYKKDLQMRGIEGNFGAMLAELASRDPTLFIQTLVVGAACGITFGIQTAKFLYGNSAAKAHERMIRAGALIKEIEKIHNERTPQKQIPND